MTPYYADEWLTVYHDDARKVLSDLPDGSVNCVVTSPPYWGLRDYGEPGQLGLESTPEAYVASLVAVFREVRRVLRSDGTVWLNLGDSYATGGGSVGRAPGGGGQGERFIRAGMIGTQPNRMPIPGLKPKDLVGIPWRVAFALQADGWYLRSDIIWSKPNPMPESVTDRPTKSHEYVFLLSKAERYWYDHDSIRERAQSSPSDLRKMAEGQDRIGGKHKVLLDPLSKASALTNIGRKRSVGGAPWQERKAAGAHAGGHGGGDIEGSGTQRNVHGEGMTHDLGSQPGRNKRSVWTVATQPYPGAHFAVFPEALVEPCILAGCPEGGTVLDPFAGSGTTGLVAQRLSRRAVLIDLSMDYLGQLMDRNRDIPLGLGA